MNLKNFEELPSLLTPKQAAEFLQISLASFYKRAYQGQIPVSKLGGSLRVSKHKLLNCLDENTRGGKK